MSGSPTTSPSLAEAAPLAARIPWRQLAPDADGRMMLRLTLVAGLVAAGLIVIQRLTFPLADLWQPLAICGGLLAVAAFYQVARPAPNFVLVLKSLAALVGFSTVYSVLMYAVATTGRPLADGMLAQSDAALGLYAPAVVQFVDARPTLAFLLWAAYFSLIPQTVLAIVVLGLWNCRANLDKFLIRFMLGGLITAVGFYLWPAKGTYGAAYALDTPDYCRLCSEHLDALRSGARRLITWRDTEGLITFPSFHTIWAVLLAAAFHGRKYLFWPAVALNVVVVISTVTTGMHYFTDVLAGLVIAGVLVKEEKAEG